MKKIFWIMIACFITFSAANVQQVQAETVKKFPDVKENTETGDAIYSMVERGILSGYPDGTFKPNQPVTNSQAAKMLAQSLDFTYDEISGPYYTDVPATHSNFKYITALRDTYYFVPNTGKEFKPNQQLSRQQMAKILVAAYALYITKDEYVTLPFTDVTTDAQREIIMPLYIHGITKGNTATTFGRNVAVTRGQFATFIYRIEQKIVKGELTGRQSNLSIGAERGSYTEVQLNDANGNSVTNKLTKEVTNFGVDIYEYQGVPAGVYVSTVVNKDTRNVETVHLAGVFNNRHLVLTGLLSHGKNTTLYPNMLMGDLAEYDLPEVKLLAIDATVGPSIHSNYEVTIEIEERNVNGEKQFFRKVLKAGKTIVQYTYTADGVKKTKNVYYATGFLNDQPYIVYHKTVEVN